jgi:hypothetical protein
VADFLKQDGFGERLQRRLKDFAGHETHDQGSWLYQMATNYEFLECRNPLLVKLNTYTLFSDDPALSRLDMTMVGPTSKESMYTAAQVKRAARLINGFLDVRDALSLGIYPQEQGDVCLHQYQFLFGITRIPMLKCDVLRGVGAQEYGHGSEHVTVLVENQAYRMAVYVNDGVRVSDADLEW